MSFHGTIDFLSVTSSFGIFHMMRSALVQTGKMQAAQCAEEFPNRWSPHLLTEASGLLVFFGSTALVGLWPIRIQKAAVKSCSVEAEQEMPDAHGFRRHFKQKMNLEMLRNSSLLL